MRVRSFYVCCLKRLFDVALSVIILVLLAPLLAVVSAILFVEFRSGFLFLQKRPGKDEKLFTIYKFKTMTDAVDEKGALLDDQFRITKIGQFLRKTSIDEAPQLINILLGDMSFVGPRPLLVEYLPLYNAYHKQRHRVKPGLTGLAQVNGRNEIEWTKRLDLDVEYAQRVSFWLDFQIVIKTIFVVFSRKGISQLNEVTMKKFSGYDS